MMKLDKLLTAIGVSVHYAQRAMENNNLAQYFNYFDRMQEEPNKIANDKAAEFVEDIDSYWVPKMEQVAIPKGSGEIEPIEVPVVALVNHSGLELDEIKIKLKVGLQEDPKSKQLYAEVEGGEPDKTTAQNEIEMTFKRSQASEGISRINQEAIGIL